MCVCVVMYLFVWCVLCSVFVVCVCAKKFVVEGVSHLPQIVAPVHSPISIL